MPEPVRSPWEESLAAAFSLVLERPVLEDTGEYAAWYSCSDLSSELFDAGFPLEPLAAGEVVGDPFASIPVLGKLFEGWDLFAPHWSIDLGASLFFGEDDELLPGREVEAAISGRELGTELIARKVKAKKLADAYPTVLFRVHTDGSLFGAIQALTGTHRGRDHLFPLDPEAGVRKRWNRRFAELDDSALADHLRNLFRTEDYARAYGAYHLGTDDPSHGYLPHPVTTAWRFGEAQAWSAVTSAS
ncbi:hypothetical protein OG225_05370 [Nocardia sp. NBC_01377]|uniref:hypothetical protein n=1 Tax=Nocardia sp. NBC_01377 TaxID=2903595 RepID=UPI00324F92A9